MGHIDQLFLSRIPEKVIKVRLLTNNVFDMAVEYAPKKRCVDALALKIRSINACLGVWVKDQKVGLGALRYVHGI